MYYSLLNVPLLNIITFHNHIIYCGIAYRYIFLGNIYIPEDYLSHRVLLLNKLTETDHVLNAHLQTI